MLPMSTPGEAGSPCVENLVESPVEGEGERSLKEGAAMGPAVPEPDALGQPLSEGFYPGVDSNPSTIKH